jgi:hypothetical protein
MIDKDHAQDDAPPEIDAVVATLFAHASTLCKKRTTTSRGSLKTQQHRAEQFVPATLGWRPL